MLEPYEWKRSRTVLRRERAGNRPDLADYATLVERLHGQVIKISPTSGDYINPMDLNLDYSDDESPLSLKSDFILSLCELIVGGKEGLQPVQKTIIDRCVRLVYHDYLNDPRPENMPVLEDLYNLLLTQEEKEAQYIATALEIYVSGSLNVFNHRTNVNIDNRIVCYDIKELGKQLKKIGMLVVQDQVWNRVTINRAAHKSTRYYIDEMHLLLKEDQTAAYTIEIWKRFRKWGGIPTGITQNIKDLLASREIENIFENSDFVYMLNQASGDRQILARQLGISPHQLSYSSAPMQMVTVLGVVTLILSLVMGAQTLIRWAMGHAADGFTTVIILLLLIGSILMLSLGIIGYYIAELFIEIKARPRYLVARTCGQKERSDAE